ncbi:sorbosone dehydrogenase family protein, partial [Sinorhizobium meliloti]
QRDSPVTSEASPPAGETGGTAGGAAPPAAGTTPPEPPQTDVAPATLPRATEQGSPEQQQ